LRPDELGLSGHDRVGMPHRLLRPDRDVDAAQDDLLACGAQSGGVLVHRPGVLGRYGEGERVAVESDLVGLLVQQRGLDRLRRGGVQERQRDRRLGDVRHRIEALQLLHDVDEHELHMESFRRRTNAPISSARTAAPRRRASGGACGGLGPARP